MHQLIGRFLAFATIAATAGCSSGKTNSGGSSTDCTKLQTPSNSDFCSSDNCNPALDCRHASQRPINDCCVLVSKPGAGIGATLKRSTSTKKYAGTGAPDVSCFSPAGYPAKPPSGKPKLVTMQGLVQAFAHGCDMAGVKIEVYKVKRTGDPATDGELGDLVGTPVSTDPNSTVTLTDTGNCNDPRKDRAYTYDKVPMYTELVVKTSDASTGLWAPLVTYNIYITDNDPEFSNGVYTHNLEALAADDFQTIPAAAFSRPISPGNGAIGGEVHDCGNVRLQNASVDVTASRAAFVYFNDDEDNPLPKLGSQGTGRTALYAALDVKPGFARVAADGLMPDGKGGTKVVSLGYYDVRVFADSVTSVSLRGLRPFQVP
jgi:hypothetical protein